jgi:GDP-L-fucose synthase
MNSRERTVIGLLHFKKPSPSNVDTNSRIFVAGHRGLVGSAIQRSLKRQGFHNLVLRTRAELDLMLGEAVQHFFAEERPEYVFLAAAKVGGIWANQTYPANFIRENLAIQSNVIDASYRSGVKRLLFLGSSCIYPKFCSQPIREQSLLTGALEPTNRPYAVAKIAGIEMCSAYNRQFGTQYLAVMPANLYGPGDNYDCNTSHVLPALIRKVAEARSAGQRHVTVWGTGTPRRELLYSDDLADACVFLANLPDTEFDQLVDADPPTINVGANGDLSIREIAECVCRALGFEGELVFDTSMPDGTPRKLLDSSRINQLGWRPKVSLEEGIRLAFEAAEDLILQN